MLETIAIILLVLWLLGIVSGYTMGNFIYILLVIAVVLPFASAVLWGAQYGASLVAAVAALWILPPALLGLLGYLVYRLLEFVFGRLGLR